MNIMTFEKALDVKAIDIVDAWTATNTDTGVSIILNNRGKYELWLAETLIEEFRFMKGDKVIVKIGKSSDGELQQLSKKFGDTVSGVVIGQTGKIVMVKTDKGQINPFVKDVIKEKLALK